MVLITIQPPHISGQQTQGIDKYITDGAQMHVHVGATWKKYNYYLQTT